MRPRIGLRKVPLTWWGFDGGTLWEDGLVELDSGRRIEKPYPTGQIALYSRAEGKSKSVSLAKMVGEAFVPNPEGWRYIKFKDGNPMNCSADNLEWCPKRPRRSRRELWQHRDTIICMHVDGKSVGEIASTLGCGWSFTKDIVQDFERSVMAYEAAHGPVDRADQ